MELMTVTAFLEALAVGDAFGKATEYCAQEEIESRLGQIDELLPPERSLTHEDLFHGQVTDDTEQNVWLIRAYARDGAITPENTAEALLDWVIRTDAAQKYIGPNSLRALQKIAEGAEVDKAGLSGTTCGGIMRAPAAFLFSTPQTLESNIVSCLMPTHNTAAAMEAAMAYGWALQAAAQGESMEGVLDAACHGAAIGKKHGSRFRTAAVVPSCESRIRYLQRIMPDFADARELKRFLYEIYGTTLASCDVCAAVFALFMWSGRDVYLAIRLATEMGGDSDTIACLAAALCCLYAKGHNLPGGMVELVGRANGLDFDQLAGLVLAAAEARHAYPPTAGT